MKVVTAKAASISLVTVGVAFVGGFIIASRPAPQKPVVALKAAADTSTTQSTSTAPTTSTTVQPAPTATTTDPSASTSTTYPSGAQSTVSAPTSPSTTTSTSSTSTTSQSVSAPTVTAVSATVGDWSNPAPTASLFFEGGAPVPTTVQYNYCVWTYSDGSTQQRAYQTKYSASKGGMSTLDNATYDCTVANAPAPN